MKVTSTLQHVFTFTDLEKDVPNPYVGRPRKAVITTVTLTWIDYREPQNDLNGGTTSLDYKFVGWDCTCTGKIIRNRQKPRSPQKLPDFVQTYEFLLELIDKIGVDFNLAQGLLIAPITAQMEAEVREWLAQAKQRQKD